MCRPSDYLDTGFEAQEPQINGPRLGPFEWLRWAWRQLTSMRTALLLLLALAIAAVPGSLIPQEASDPNGVIQWKQSNPQLTGLVEGLQGFTVYTSVWFSAIYLLLFVSLVGCVLARITHHLQALRDAPPPTHPPPLAGPPRPPAPPPGAARPAPGVPPREDRRAGRTRRRRGRTTAA